MDVSATPPRPLETVLTGHGGGFAHTPDGKSLVADDHNTVRFFDVSEAKPKELAPVQNGIIGVSPFLAPGKGLLATIVTDRKSAMEACQFWDLTGSKPRPWPNENSSVIGKPAARSLSPINGLTSNGESAVISNEGSSSRIAKWTANGFEFQDKLPMLSRGLSNSDGRILVGPEAKTDSSDAKSVRLWDIAEPFENARELPELEGMDIGNMAVRSDRSLLVSVPQHGNGDTILWHLAEKKAIRVAVLPEKYDRVELSPDGRWLIGRSSWKAHVYDLSGKQPKRLPQFGDDVGAVAATFSPDAKRFYVSDGNGNLRGYHIATGKVVWEAKLPGPATWLQMAPTAATSSPSTVTAPFTSYGSTCRSCP